jgi:hypothetical protein
MKSRARFLVALSILVLMGSAHAWGWMAHRLINAAALEVLPADMKAAIGSHGDVLVRHAADPDHWKSNPLERHRHYIDLEMGDRAGYPYTALPRMHAEARRVLGDKKLADMGILPWWIETYTDSTIQSMRDPNARTWIRMAALSHYVADGHMPLHTTVNYDGQLTGNRSIHFRFEWWMLEQNRSAIHLTPHELLKVGDPLNDAWTFILRSHTAVDTILAADTRIREELGPPWRGFHKGDTSWRIPNPVYDQRLWEETGELAQRKMSLAAEAVAGYWYHAWVKAGKPDLRAVPDPD